MAKEITVGYNQHMWTKYKGTCHGTVSQQDGSHMNIMLTDVLYVPDLWFKLLYCKSHHKSNSKTIK
jgi:hypothetical protein